MINKTISILVTIFLFSSCIKDTIILKTGDLLFQDLDCGPLCDAIENSTLGKNGERFSHIAIVLVAGNKTYAIEAYDGVSKTPIQEFLRRDVKPNENSHVVVGRLKKPYQRYVPKAIEQAAKRIGLPYDDEFKLNNDKYYCSEFIHDIF